MVFVCYSRAQFYVAEDLALALGQNGIDAWFDVHRLKPADDWDREIIEALRASDALVLVGSPDALGSPHVRAELDLARELRKPVVVALAEQVDMPSALADAPRVDLRARFEDGVHRLATGLKAGNHDALDRDVESAWTARAGVVWMVCGLLLGSALLWEAGAVGMLKRGLSTGTADLAMFQVVGFALIGAFFGWLWLAFSRRRPGSPTLLGVAFAYSVLTGVMFCGLIVYVGVASPGLIEGFEVATVAIVIYLAAWLGTGIWALRAPPFYRWLPTGDAPRWMRRRMLAQRGYRAGSQAQPAAVSVSYDIRCHELDGSVELALDAAQQAAGHRRVHSPSADRQILVLSNLTPIEGLAQSLAQFGARAVVVISAPISLAALQDVERYQWVDYRRRNGHTLDRLAASIGSEAPVVDVELVPESLSRRVVPLAVLAAGALCVIAAAVNLASGIAGLGGADIGAVYGASHATARTVAVLLLGGATLWIAMALFARRIPLRYFLVGFVSVYIVTLATPWVLTGSTWVGLSVLPGAVLGAAMIFLGRQTLADWLPPRAVRANTPTLAPENAAWWRRPGARGVLLYTAALTTFLLVGLRPLADEGGVPRVTAYSDVLMEGGRYSSAVFCLQLEADRLGGASRSGNCTGNVAEEWVQARSALKTALEQVYAHGSVAGVNAARKIEAVLPSSVNEAQESGADYYTDPQGVLAAYTSFSNVVCPELDGVECQMPDLEPAGA